MARNIGNLTPPIVDYRSITVGGVSYELSDSIKVSYKAPFNQISITLRPNVTLSKYIIRVTKAGDPYGIETGTLIYSYPGLVSMNTDTLVSFQVTQSAFPTEGAYRISLYAQSTLDYSWDVTYLLFENNSLQLIDKDGNILSCYTTKMI